MPAENRETEEWPIYRVSTASSARSKRANMRLTCFSPPEINSAVALAHRRNSTPCVFEMEHNAYDIRLLRDCLQYMLNRGQIAQPARWSPAVTPFVAHSAERRRDGAIARQAGFRPRRLRHRVGRIFRPSAQAANAVGACRYPRLKRQALYEPAGIRGDGPTTAARYWGISQQEYYQRRRRLAAQSARARFSCILHDRRHRGIKNLNDMLKNVPGIGAILIGEGDLSQELGYPRQYEHKVVLDAMAQIVDTCKEANVVVGHPHVEPAMPSASSRKATAS